MIQAFLRQFGTQPQVQSSSPGRINLIGEHTDYNDGFVLPGAIDKRISFSLAQNGHPDLCRVYSIDLDDSVEFSLNSLQKSVEGSWKNYAIGVAAELMVAGAKFEGFDAIFTGDVPLGAGLSSSAALECALATGLNTLFGLGFNQLEIIHISQMAEHHYAGVECGIMDQFASVMGKKDQVFLLDCRTKEYEHFSLNLEDYQLLLLDTCVEHSLADTAYNERRSQCEQGAATLKKWYPEVVNLRDVTLTQLQKHRADVPAIIYQRCLHVIEENDRVHQACRAISDKDIPRLGALLYQSHDSLSKGYEVSCPELDFLVDFTREREEIVGARMMGGGFGGCTLNLVNPNEKEAFIDAISAAYLAETGIPLKAYAVSLENGAQAQLLQ